MYIETSYPRQKGDNAQLSSMSYGATTGSCFQFWYHMYGKDIGTLNIYIKYGSNAIGKPVWTRSGDMENVWRISQLTIKSSTAFQVT